MRTKIVGLFVLFLAATTVFAQAPQKIDVGDIQVWKLQDTQMDMKLSMLSGVDMAQMKEANDGKDS